MMDICGLYKSWLTNFHISFLTGIRNVSILSTQVILLVEIQNPYQKCKDSFFLSVFSISVCGEIWNAQVALYCTCGLLMESGLRRSIVLFGDSITQGSFTAERRGWGCRMSDWFCRYVDVFNRGFSGYNSRWALSVLPSILSSNFGNLATAVIFFGANDAVRPGESQHVPLEEYCENLKAIIDAFREHNADISLILVTPPPVDHTQWPSRHNNLVYAYAESVRNIAIEKAVILADLWSDDAITVDDLDDGLHLNESGNYKVFSAVRQGVYEAWPYLRSLSVMPMQYPDWKLLVGKSKEESHQILENWKWE